MDPTDLTRLLGDDIINSSHMQLAVIKLSNKYFKDIEWHGIKVPYFELFVSKANRFGAPSEKLLDAEDFIKEICDLMPRRLTPEIKMNYCEMISSFKRQCDEKNIGRPYYRLHIHNQKRSPSSKQLNDLAYSRRQKTGNHSGFVKNTSSKMMRSGPNKDSAHSKMQFDGISSLAARSPMPMISSRKPDGMRVAWADMVDDSDGGSVKDNSHEILSLYRRMALSKEETLKLISMFEFMSLDSEAKLWREKI